MSFSFFLILIHPRTEILSKNNNDKGEKGNPPIPLNIETRVFWLNLIIKLLFQPAGEGMLYHNFCHSKLRYSDCMILARTCSNNKLKKHEICEKLVQRKIQGSGCLVVTDRGYCTLSTVRYFTSKKIPFMGTIQQR